jgi:hypothetical protein
MYRAISSLGQAITSALPPAAANNSLVSTTASLGTQGYISTASLTSSLAGTTQATYASTLSTTTSSINALGTLGYISTASLISTVAGLGSLGYISTPLGAVMSQGSLTSSITGLGSVGYVSTGTLQAAVNSLGTTGYISTASLQNTVARLGTVGYVSTSGLTSSLAGLGTAGYISTSALVSTTIALSTQKANIRFDTTGSVTVTGNNTVNFATVGNIIYISTFLQSSISYSGLVSGLELTARNPKLHDLIFSTTQMDFSPFAAFMNSTSRLTLDVYPSFTFSKLATGATSPAVLPISTMVQYGMDLLSSPCVTSFLYVGNTKISLENGTSVDASNLHATPVRLTFPPSSIIGKTALPYTLVHLMPSSLNNAAYQNALHSAKVTPFFSPTGSLFVSVQNIPTN